MPLALTFSKEIDVTGVATVGLALLTLLLVVAALLQARLVGRQVRDARQPVLVPGGSTPDAQPRVVAGSLVVPVANVGIGPALQITGTVAPADGSARGHSRRPLPGLTVGGVGELVFTAGFGPNSAFALTLSCRDAAHASHETKARWDPNEGFLDIRTSDRKRRRNAR